MSATIGINDLKFVIFGAGHDYTLADSGDGDVQVFSHPFVPLNSVNYAGQWYFLVPDENGDPLDAVKDDVAHCTFTPAIGATFDTAGEVTVECHYHREYVHDEETIVVDKTVSQIITVVNHGSVSDSTNNLDVYSDGYGFIRPLTANGVEQKEYTITQKNAVKKLSSLPWRVTGLGIAYNYTGFFASTQLTDISEFAFADMSKCKTIISPFGKASGLTDISALEGWDVSNVTLFRDFINYSGVNSLKPLAKWNTSKFKDMERAFSNFKGTKLEGLENWDVSKVTNMRSVFDHAENLNDASAIANWDVSKVQTLYYAFSYTKLTATSAFSLWNVTSLKNMEGIFYGCDRLVDLSGLSNWVAEITTIRQAFALCTALRDIGGIHGLDVSSVTNFTEVFAFSVHIASLEGLENWDVSSGGTFYRMFKGCPWINDLSPLANWDMSNAYELGEMFMGDAWVTSMDDLANWRLNTNAVHNMCVDGRGCYSSKIGKNLYYNAYYYYDYQDRQYVNSEVADEDNPLTYPTYDADKASLWGVVGSNLYAFDSHWINKPSWN